MKTRSQGIKTPYGVKVPDAHHGCTTKNFVSNTNCTPTLKNISTECQVLRPGLDLAPTHVLLAYTRSSRNVQDQKPYCLQASTSAAPRLPAGGLQRFMIIQLPIFPTCTYEHVRKQEHQGWVIR
eukprot:scaffold72129_cov18-Tisochrysis_lutea.AAC.1